MPDGHVADVLFYGMMLLLPLSALIVRREKPGKLMKMAAAWVLIFGVAAILIARRDLLPTLGRSREANGTEVKVAMAVDGHFWVNASVDGTKRRMLIDSGATTTALSFATARTAGLNLSATPFATLIETANGRVAAHSATVAAFRIGTISLDNVTVVVAPEFGSSDVIGMNVLSRLASWRVDGRTLILRQ